MTTSQFKHQNDLIGIFAQHPVAANLLMIIMLLSGAWSLGKLNTQFFPSSETEVVTVKVVWNGASAEDVERSLTVPMEQALRTVDGLDKMTSTSSQGISVITLEFPEGTDMGPATDRIDEKVNTIRNFPADAEDPLVSHIQRFENIANLLIYGTQERQQLRHLAHEFERQLLDLGIAKVDIQGLPEEELAIQVPLKKLQEMDLSIAELATQIDRLSTDLPAGTIGRSDLSRQLRSLNQQKNESGFAQLKLNNKVGGDDDYFLLGDIAEIKRQPKPNQVDLSFQGWPAVELQLRRSENADSLKSAQIMEDWLVDIRPQLPPNIKIQTYDERWLLIQGRIHLLLKNGLGGLLLVVLILYIFLNSKVALWVTVGIPISFTATLAVIYLLGGSINMISLFALIMALGIIVDDAIVVGEDALTHFQTGEGSLEAAEGGAKRMFAPVMSSSLTTIAAFIPLLSISGVIGKILFDIPFVVICVIVASVIESFFVLPGHLRHSFKSMPKQAVNSLRQRWDKSFDHFKNHHFRAWVTVAIRHRGITLASLFSAMLIVIGTVASGRVGFTFFPNIEGNIIMASTTFVAGTPPRKVDAFINEVEQALYLTEKDFGGGLVRISSVVTGEAALSNGRQKRRGEQFATVTAELISSDLRDVRNEAFLKKWEANLKMPPGLESITLSSRRGGHPGRDLEIRLTGENPGVLKAAALEITQHLKGIAGISAIEDDMPYGKQQLIYDLTEKAKSLGLTHADVGRQLRGALDGELVQIFNQGNDEVEVRVMLSEDERDKLSTLQDIRFRLANGHYLDLASAISLKENRGFEVLRHSEGQLALNLYADVDRSQNNANEIRASLSNKVLPDIAQKYAINWRYAGRAEDQSETFTDMKRGGLLALAMIYIVLAWIFASYRLPFVVLSIIPFGIIGAIFGHWVMGIELTILSMFGLFGLSGIVVNDSIILIVFYKQLLAEGMAKEAAVIEASCQRLRAVLLTSLTTIAGLTPLLFETSLQAQFLIPMAVSISFGLAFATVLVLILVPTLLIGTKIPDSLKISPVSDKNASDQPILPGSVLD